MEIAKTAVVLMNLGGPQSLNKVEEFLFSLFYDKTIINLPNPVRWLIAKTVSKLRKNKARGIYSLMGGKSPILEQTIAQKEALQQILGNEKFTVMVCMRHSEPGILKLVEEIRQKNIKEILCIPLYPQFSYTTTHSAIEQIKNHCQGIKFKAIGCFYSSAEFIASQVELIKESLTQTIPANTVLVFSAHSLPEKIIKSGDPYQSQVEKTVKMIMQHFDGLEHIICYQSKIGPVKWLEPNTEHVIKRLNEEKKDIVVIPISFVSEHSETLVELDIEYAELAYQSKYIRVPTLQTNQVFINCLKNLVHKMQNQEKQITSAEGIRICDNKFNYCICK